MVNMHSCYVVLCLSLADLSPSVVPADGSLALLRAVCYTKLLRKLLFDSLIFGTLHKTDIFCPPIRLSKICSRVLQGSFCCKALYFFQYFDLNRADEIVAKMASTNSFLYLCVVSSYKHQYL